MRRVYHTNGTCASEIRFDIEDGIVKNVEFVRGCAGNLKAIPRLIDGWKAEDVIAKLKGVTCGEKSTSCADQLASALAEALKQS